ncbi:MAG: hypothetical protein GEU74_10845 [Nitriliruptorales bacterium]|nr:hypothetical protein [Nitriliruptorales bacterium]
MSLRHSLDFFLVDVFAEAPFSGNPLAVVANADSVHDRLMRAIAREFNQSETTFLLSRTRKVPPLIERSPMLLVSRHPYGRSRRRPATCTASKRSN